jgi:hypothetical protein
MSFDQLRPSQQSPDAPIARVQPIWAAEVYEDAADVNSTVRVRLPTADGGVKLFGPCPFMPRGSAVPQKGDQALLAFDDEGEPWIIGWQGSFSGGGGGSYTDEEARDAVGAALTDSSTIDFTVNDGANTITADVKNSGITSAQIADGTIVHGDVAAANKDGADATPSLRTLGTGAGQAAKGSEVVRTSGNQTGLAGNKSWTGAHTFDDDVAVNADSFIVDTPNGGLLELKEAATSPQFRVDADFVTFNANFSIGFNTPSVSMLAFLGLFGFGPFFNPPDFVDPTVTGGEVLMFDLGAGWVVGAAAPETIYANADNTGGGFCIVYNSPVFSSDTVTLDADPMGAFTMPAPVPIAVGECKMFGVDGWGLQIMEIG